MDVFGRLPLNFLFKVGRLISEELCDEITEYMMLSWHIYKPRRILEINVAGLALFKVWQPHIPLAIDAGDGHIFNTWKSLNVRNLKKLTLYVDGGCNIFEHTTRYVEVLVLLDSNDFRTSGRVVNISSLSDTVKKIYVKNGDLVRFNFRRMDENCKKILSNCDIYYDIYRISSIPDPIVSLSVKNIKYKILWIEYFDERIVNLKKIFQYREKIYVETLVLCEADEVQFDEDSLKIRGLKKVEFVRCVPTANMRALVRALGKNIRVRIEDDEVGEENKVREGWGGGDFTFLEPIARRLTADRFNYGIIQGGSTNPIVPDYDVEDID